jgi:hypothetical protein
MRREETADDLRPLVQLNLREEIGITGNVREVKVALDHTAAR